jgi:hypothetical protein
LILLRRIWISSRRILILLRWILISLRGVWILLRLDLDVGAADFECLRAESRGDRRRRFRAAAMGRMAGRRQASLLIWR